jgi:DNA repair photolyase
MECTVFLSPILPLLTDRPAQLEELVHAVASAGATSVLYTPLSLSGGVKDVFFGWLRAEHPRLVRDYEALYSTGSETPQRYRDWSGDRIRPVIAGYGLPDPDETIRDHRGQVRAARTAYDERAVAADPVLNLRPIMTPGDGPVAAARQ